MAGRRLGRDEIEDVNAAIGHAIFPVNHAGAKAAAVAGMTGNPNPQITRTPQPTHQQRP